MKWLSPKDVEKLYLSDKKIHVYATPFEETFPQYDWIEAYTDVGWLSESYVRCLVGKWSDLKIVIKIDHNKLDLKFRLEDGEEIVWGQDIKETEKTPLELAKEFETVVIDTLTDRIDKHIRQAEQKINVLKAHNWDHPSLSGPK